MNQNFVNIIKRIIAEQGEAILSDAARLKSFVSDYAKAEPSAERLAFGRCIEAGAYNELKRASDAQRRQSIKTFLARKVNANAGVDIALCSNALDVLEAAMFGIAPIQQQSAYQQSTPYQAPQSAYQQQPYTTPQIQQPIYQQPTPYQAPQSAYQQQYYVPPQAQQPVYQQTVQPQYQSPHPAVKTGGLWTAVLVCNIIGLNWISRFITGHVGTGILILLLDIATIALLGIGIGVVLFVVGLIIWITDLVKIGTKKWQMGDGTYLAP